MPSGVILRAGQAKILTWHVGSIASIARRIDDDALYASRPFNDSRPGSVGSRLLQRRKASKAFFLLESWPRGGALIVRLS